MGQDERERRSRYQKEVKVLVIMRKSDFCKSQASGKGTNYRLVTNLEGKTKEPLVNGLEGLT